MNRCRVTKVPIPEGALEDHGMAYMMAERLIRTRETFRWADRVDPHNPRLRCFRLTLDQWKGSGQWCVTASLGTNDTVKRWFPRTDEARARALFAAINHWTMRKTLIGRYGFKFD